jgi:hypothetical protein
VSITWTAVAGSLTAGDSARRPMSARRRNASIGSCGRYVPAGHQPGEHRRIGHLTAVQIGDRSPFLQRVAYTRSQHDPASWANLRRWSNVR